MANITLSTIPSNVSGDGKNFVSALKNYLSKVESKAESASEESGASCKQVTELRLYQEENGTKHNIRVRFNPSNISNYAGAEIWLREGDRGSWTKKGTVEGVQCLLEDVSANTEYYVKVVGINLLGNVADFNEAPMQSITIVAAAYVCNTPTQFFWNTSTKKWEWSGYVDNGYTEYFEIRLDQKPGTNLTDRTKCIETDIRNRYYSTVAPTVRLGTAYLYVRNTYGYYNTPAVHIFNIEAPSKPSQPSLVNVGSGILICMDTLPDDSFEYLLEINGDKYETHKQRFQYYVSATTTPPTSLSVRYAISDGISTGEYSNMVTVNYADIPLGDEDTITEFQIADNSIGGSKIQANAITTDKIDAYAITATKIATNAIQIGGANNNVTIQNGSINGNKLVSNSVNTAQLAAGCITTNELKAQAISLSGDLKIVSGNGLTVFNEDGISFKDNNGYTFANVGRQLIGYNVAHGHHVVFTHAWDRVPYVMCIPRNITLTAPGWNSSNVSMYCNAYNISNTGFYVRCENIIEGGAKIITTISDQYTNLYDIGMTDDHHHYNAESGKTGTTTYPAVSVSTGSHLTSYTYTKSYTKPAAATKAIIQFSWKSQPTWNGSVYPRVYLQTANGTTVATYSGYSATPASGGYTISHDVGQDASGTVTDIYDDPEFGVSNIKLSGNLSSSDTTFKIKVELCYRRYHNHELKAHLTYFSIDSYEIESAGASQLATGTVDFIACEVNETSYS